MRFQWEPQTGHSTTVPSSSVSRAMTTLSQHSRKVGEHVIAFFLQLLSGLKEVALV